MATLTQPTGTKRKPLSRRCQVFLTEDAYLRLKLEAARKQVPMGRIISELSEQYLPAVEVAA